MSESSFHHANLTKAFLAKDYGKALKYKEDIAGILTRYQYHDIVYYVVEPLPSTKEEA